MSRVCVWARDLPSAAPSSSASPNPMLWQACDLLRTSVRVSSMVSTVLEILSSVQEMTQFARTLAKCAPGKLLYARG